MMAGMSTIPSEMQVALDVIDEVRDEWRSLQVPGQRLPLNPRRKKETSQAAIVLPVDQFGAERLSMFIPRGEAGQVFDPSAWSALCDPDSIAAEAFGIGIDVPPSRETATVCVAGRRPDGLLHLEWYETQDGTAWLPEWCRPRIGKAVRAVVVDQRNAAAELDWRAAGVRPTVATSRDVPAAAGALFEAVTSGTLRHRGQTELTRAVLGARQRAMMGGHVFGWDRKAPGSSVLLAASLALWAVDAQTVERPLRALPGTSGGGIAVL